MNYQQLIKDLKSNIKEEICRLLINLYKETNNGLLPNWSEEEEIIIDSSNFKKFSLKIEIFDTHSNTIIIDKQEIIEYVVTLDSNLYFNTECNNYEWNEIPMEELYAILECIKTKF